MIPRCGLVTLALVIVTLNLPHAYTLNPQVFYKDILIVGGEDIKKYLESIMIIEPNIEVLTGELTRNYVNEFDVLILASDAAIDPDIVYEWFNVGGKVVIISSYGESINRVLARLGAGIRVGVGTGDLESLFFNPPRLPDYVFEREYIGYRFPIKIDTRISIASESSNQYLLYSDEGSLVLAVEYIPVYSDLFTLYHSKVIALSTNIDSIPEEITLEILSWGVTVYLTPNNFSVALSLSLVLTMLSVYIGIWIFSGKSLNR